MLALAIAASTFIAAEGKNYVVSLEGDAYLVSMQIGDVLVTYRED